jgi:hypothetical protein
MTVNIELDHVVKYFKETFNDTIFYCLNKHGELVVKTDLEVIDNTDIANIMFDYDEKTQKLLSLFNHTLRMISPHIDLSKSTPDFVEYWKTHYLRTYNYPSRLYAALQKALGPTQKMIDTNIYSISIQLKTIDEQIIITHEVIFSMYNKIGGTDSFIVTLDENLELLDVVLYETGNLFLKHSKGLEIEDKKNLFIVVLGTLINKEFAKYFDKSNIDYSERSIELLTMLEF